MRSLLAIILSLVWLYPAWAKDSTQCQANFTTQWWPQKMVSAFTADARTHRLQLLKTTKGPEYYCSMGGQFPIANLKAFNKTLQVSTAASTYLTLARYVHRGQVINVDFFVDFLFDLELSKTWYLRGGFGHTSQHLADDAVLAGTVAKNYVKDYGLFHSIHKLAKNNLTLYEGIYYFDNFKIGDSVPFDWSKKIMLQVGAEYRFLKLSAQSFLYAAADVKFRQEFNFGTTQNIQAGYVSQNNAQRKFRFAYNFLSGYEERGNFYHQQTKIHTVGAYFEF